MAYNSEVAERVRRLLRDHGAFEEKRMFGGLAFLLQGHMCCGVLGDELMLRVGPAAYAGALRTQHARAMDFTGKPLQGFIFVEPAGFATARDLAAWLTQAIDFCRTLPAK